MSGEYPLIYRIKYPFCTCLKCRFSKLIGLAMNEMFLVHICITLIDIIIILFSFFRVCAMFD